MGGSIMTSNKFFKKGILVILGLSLLIGCTAKQEVVAAESITMDGVSVSDVPACELLDPEDTPIGFDKNDFDIVGEIMEIDGDNVHLLFGDIVEVFKVKNASDYYLGETVKLLGEEGNQSLEAFMIKNFEIKHTSMGNMIEKAKGTVKSLEANSIVIVTEEGDETFETYGEIMVQLGDKVEVEYVYYGGRDSGKSVLRILPLASNMIMTVQSIERTDSGLMIIKGIEDSGMESYVDISIGTNDNFNFSDLKVGDRVHIIPEIIMESYPMQVKPLRVTLEK